MNLRNYLLLIFSLLLIACSQVKEKADEPFRPAYHHSPEFNWMNDPNGMFYDAVNGIWHLYFQYNPESTIWDNMTWGHSTSADLIHWQHHDPVLYPDELGMIYSGSCVVDHDNTADFGEDAVIAVYTSDDKGLERQSIAYSVDGGFTFTKYEGNPVLTGDVKDFRDPKVWREGAEWRMALAAGQEIRFYGSADLKQWNLLSAFGEGYGSHNGVWECPDLVRIGDEYVLIVNISPGGPAGGSATQYFVGQWDGVSFTADYAEPRWMDYGKDQYATVSFSEAPDDRIVVMAWVSNWQYSNHTPYYRFRAINSIARDLALFTDLNGVRRLRVMPSPENDALDIPEVSSSFSGKPVNKRLGLNDNVARVDIDITLNADPITVILANAKEEQVVLTLNNDSLTFDRTRSGLVNFHKDFSAVMSAPLLQSVERDIHHLTLFIDRSSIEVFLDNGELALTNLVFPTEVWDRIIVK